MTVTPSDKDLLERAIEHRLAEVHTSMPGEVVRVHAGDHGRQFVDVQPSLSRWVSDEDDKRVREALPVIQMCPVAWPQAGGFFISMPLRVGDIVTILFAERSIDQWIEKATKGTDGKRTYCDGDLGSLTLNGAIVLPFGPAPRRELLGDVHAANLVIGLDGGAQIHITPDGEVRVGAATAAQAMVLGTAHAAALDTFVTALGVLAAAIVVPTGVPDAGTKTTFAAAVTAFKAHLSAGALSVKHKLDQ